MDGRWLVGWLVGDEIGCWSNNEPTNERTLKATFHLVLLLAALLSFSLGEKQRSQLLLTPRATTLRPGPSVRPSTMTSNTDRIRTGSFRGVRTKLRGRGGASGCIGGWLLETNYEYRLA